MKIALVKESGKILKIKSQWKTSLVKISFSLDEYKMEIPGGEETYFKLSDEKNYKEEELIVGKENIREWKLNKLTK